MKLLYQYYASMTTKRSTKKSAKKTQEKPGWMALRPRMDFRFESHEHRELVQRAADLEKRSMNDWMVQATIRAAKKRLSIPLKEAAA